MPPTDSHVAREFAALKGAALRFSFCEKKQKGHFGIAFLFRKAWKERFSFHEKHIRDVFMLLFASAKSNQKQTEGCDPLDFRGRFKAL